MQVIHDASAMIVTAEDIRHRDAARQRAAIVRQIAAWRQEPFDFARGPLIRAALLARRTKTMCCS